MQASQGRVSAFSTTRLVTMAVFAAICCVAAYISIPLPLPGAPHITLQNFVIILIALLFTSGEAFLIILVWMLLGIIGLPVFIAGGSGIGYLLMPYGGYTTAFPLIGILVPLLAGREYQRVRFTLAAIAGVVLIDVIGMCYLMYASHLSPGAAFTAGFVPFLPLDLAKAVVAAQMVPGFRRVIG